MCCVSSRGRSVSQSEIERRSLFQFRLRPNEASMFPNNALHRDQADPRTFKVFATMQPLKDPKQLIGVLHAEPHSIVANHDGGRSVAFDVADFNDGVGPGSGLWGGGLAW